QCDPPDPPTDPQPADGSCVEMLRPMLRWVGATYECELWVWSDDDPRFLWPTYSYWGIVPCGSTSAPMELLPGRTYFWKVRVYNDCDYTDGPTWQFTVAPCAGCYGDCDESGELDFF